MCSVMDHAIRWIANMGEIPRNKKEKLPVLCSWGNNERSETQKVITAHYGD